MIPGYPKIFAIGTSYIKDIFNEPVEITEKIDGSQFAFGRINGDVVMRSKNNILYPESADKMFWPAMKYVNSIVDRLPNNVVFYAEYLRRPKHNAIQYDRIPKNNLALFGVHELGYDIFLLPELTAYDEILEIDIAPILHEGHINSIEDIKSMLDRESYLGGAKIEGVVVKNYHRQWILGDRPMPLMAGKLVSEEFKEVNKHVWDEQKSKNKIERFMDSFRTEARWNKAVQHARDYGMLSDDPKDIGTLIRLVHEDIAIEEEQEIKNFLWRELKGDIFRKSTKGFPEWYKEQLAEMSLRI